MTSHNMKFEPDLSLIGLKLKLHWHHGAAGRNQLKWLLNTLIIIKMKQIVN